MGSFIFCHVKKTCFFQSSFSTDLCLRNKVKDVSYLVKYNFKSEPQSPEDELMKNEIDLANLIFTVAVTLK